MLIHSSRVWQANCLWGCMENIEFAMAPPHQCTEQIEID